jgi:tRNA G18 (ribose-2'-O)-methylase SpoU
MASFDDRVQVVKRVNDRAIVVMWSHNLAGILRYARVSPVKQVIVDHRESSDGYKFFVQYMDGATVTTFFQSDKLAVGWVQERRAWGKRFTMISDNDTTTFNYT